MANLIRWSMTCFWQDPEIWSLNLEGFPLWQQLARARKVEFEKEQFSRVGYSRISSWCLFIFLNSPHGKINPLESDIILAGSRGLKAPPLTADIFASTIVQYHSIVSQVIIVFVEKHHRIWTFKTDYLSPITIWTEPCIHFIFIFVCEIYVFEGFK